MILRALQLRHDALPHMMSHPMRQDAEVVNVGGGGM
jgi:hypothetical protein